MMSEELSEQWQLWTCSEEPESYDMAYIRNKLAVKMNRSGVSERSDRKATRGYQ
jgi:hypothetical protein